MARTLDIVAVVTPIVIVVAVAVSSFYRPEPKKPPPDRVLVVCNYDTPDERTLTFVTEGRECGACRRHPLYAKNGGEAMNFTGCYRQVQKGVRPDVPLEEADPKWTAAESEASVCDGLPTTSSEANCDALKGHSLACRRQCHRDPDCATMCRNRCDARAFCKKPASEPRKRTVQAARVDS